MSASAFPAPLSYAHPLRCVRTLEPGMVKRAFGVTGPLHAYYVACPWCGFTSLLMQAEVGFEEGPMVEAMGPPKVGAMPQPFRHFGLVRARESIACGACRRRACIRDGGWSACD